MPRKKQTVGPGPGASPGPAKLNCPACKSEISADGSTLHSRSKYLDELLEDAEAGGKMDAVVDALEKKLAGVKAENEELKKQKAAVQTKPEGSSNVEKERKSSWW